MFNVNILAHYIVVPSFQYQYFSAPNHVFVCVRVSMCMCCLTDFNNIHEFYFETLWLPQKIKFWTSKNSFWSDFDYSFLSPWVEGNRDEAFNPTSPIPYAFLLFKHILFKRNGLGGLQSPRHAFMKWACDLCCVYNCI